MSRVQIFLGGSCNPTTWRRNVAIPYLEMNGITYYNPQIDNWTPDVVKTERQAKQNAQVLLFVIDKQTRSTVSLVESAYMAGANKKLVLVIYPFDYDVLSLTDKTTKQTSNIIETRSEVSKTSLKASDKSENTSSSFVKSSTSSTSTIISRHSSGVIKINDEVISLGELQELRRARFILRHLVAKKKIPMYTDILQALEYVSSCLNTDGGGSGKESTSDAMNLTSLPSTKHEQNSTSSSLNIESQAIQKDIYVTFDGDGNSIITNLLPTLNERGLSYNFTPMKDILDPMKVPALPKIPAPSNPHEGNLSRYSEILEPTMEQETTLILDKEIETIQRSRVLLFVVTNKSRGLSIMVLASHFIALFRDNVVLCIQYLEEPCTIDGETLTKSAVDDYNRGRVYLYDYAIKSQVPVFTTIREAIDCCSRKCGHKDSD